MKDLARWTKDNNNWDFGRIFTFLSHFVWVTSKLIGFLASETGPTRSTRESAGRAWTSCENWTFWDATEWHLVTLTDTRRRKFSESGHFVRTISLIKLAKLKSLDVKDSNFDSVRIWSRRKTAQILNKNRLSKCVLNCWKCLVQQCEFECLPCRSWSGYTNSK